VPGGRWLDARTFTGELFSSSGPAYFSGPFDPSKVKATAVGTATLRFQDAHHAVFGYRLDAGAEGEKTISRFLFGPAGPTRASSLADIYWNPTESGWGLAIAQQHRNAFAMWFVYDEAGKATWLVVPEAMLGTSGYSGELYSAEGPPSGTPYDPARVKLTKVGSATLAGPGYTTRGAAFSWSRNSAIGQSNLSRLPY
jgi:hypothetical protein